MEQKEETKITVVDSMMGSGKTSWAIDYINQHEDENIMYIAPYITETERIRDSVHREIKLPAHKGNGKIGDILKLLENEDDISSTHALFSLLTDEHKSAIERGNYTLFIDETIEAVAPYELANSNDIQYLLDKGSIKIDLDGVIHWTDLDYDTRFNPIKILAKNHALFQVNKKILIYQYPPDIFKLFKKVYVLTYMFGSSTMKYYFDLAKIEYDLKSVKRVNGEYKLVDYYEASRVSLKEKIHIYSNPDLNDIFPQKKTAFSATWYKNPDNRSKITKLQKATYNYFHNKCKAKTGETMWTTFKNSKGKLKGQGYTKSFVPLNCRATNDYAQSKFLVYPVNVYPNVGVSQFFSQRGLKINDDNYALSEMVQWIFRSAIRNGEDIHIYLPSKRMGELLENWLET
ncbi:MAG: hypothetical protein HDT42_02980 [Ruminococcaceae bacterium]|nr:hypothetical protein [Oscillospiraceae bacterium]